MLADGDEMSETCDFTRRRKRILQRLQIGEEN